MAILNSTGILIVDAKPVHTPSADQARLARLQDTMTFYNYNGTAWVTIQLDRPETFTGTVIPDNASLGEALQALENAIDSFSQDGNHSYVVRGNATEDAAPTALEVVDPIAGDTADVSLTSGKVEKWVHNGTAWSKTFTLDYKDVTNLSVSQLASSVTVESSTGTNAVIPAVSATLAGVMLPAHKSKLDNITVTQPVNLDTLESLANGSIQSVNDSNSIDLTKSGSALSAALKVSATQGADITVSIQSDGLRVVYNESKPTAYASRAAAITAIGLGKKFIYTKANLDGAIEGSVAWT